MDGYLQKSILCWTSFYQYSNMCPEIEAHRLRPNMPLLRHDPGLVRLLLLHDESKVSLLCRCN